MAGAGAPGKHQGWLGGKGSEGKMWGRDFVVISLEGTN